MSSLIDILDLSTAELDELVHTALDIAHDPSKYADACRGKKIATLFFEPSTRTRLSFEAAMYELGGSVLSVPSGAISSTSKGESISDTARIVSLYADIIALRHPLEGAAAVAASKSAVPVINAGDGGHFHPTQTLTDLLTIYREKGTFENLTIGLCGDLKYGRTVHSLVAAMSRYAGTRFVLISPEELRLPEQIMTEIERYHVPVETTSSLDEALPKLDVLYMTRIQRERFDDVASYERLKDSYILTPEKMQFAKPDCRVLHPLPRVNEISTLVDDDPRAAYFRQAGNGKLIRMALILKLLCEADGKTKPVPGVPMPGKRCPNLRCVSNVEPELRDLFRESTEKDDVCRCAFCDTAVK